MLHVQRKARFAALYVGALSRCTLRVVVCSKVSVVDLVLVWLRMF
jgi:hypothetical protein